MFLKESLSAIIVSILLFVTKGSYMDICIDEFNGLITKSQ
jgi:hypothetical protein